jgi:AcrR family transcriptional regulator
MTERVRAESASARRPSSDTNDRDAILHSALILFSELDYDQVTLSMIAHKAGLSDGRLAHLFGSKEQLFAAAVEVALTRLILSGEGTAALSLNGSAVVPLGIRMKDAGDPMALLLRGTANARSMSILRSSIERHCERPLSGALSDTGGNERAALLFALLVGIQLVSKIMDSGVSSAPDPAVLSRHLDPLLKLLIDSSEPGGAKQ